MQGRAGPGHAGPGHAGQCHAAVLGWGGVGWVGFGSVEGRRGEDVMCLNRRGVGFGVGSG